MSRNNSSLVKGNNGNMCVCVYIYIYCICTHRIDFTYLHMKGVRGLKSL